MALFFSLAAACETLASANATVAMNALHLLLLLLLSILAPVRAQDEEEAPSPDPTPSPASTASTSPSASGSASVTPSSSRTPSGTASSSRTPSFSPSPSPFFSADTVRLSASFVLDGLPSWRCRIVASSVVNIGVNPALCLANHPQFSFSTRNSLAAAVSSTVISPPLTAADVEFTSAIPSVNGTLLDSLAVSMLPNAAANAESLQAAISANNLVPSPVFAGLAKGSGVGFQPAAEPNATYTGSFGAGLTFTIRIRFAAAAAAAVSSSSAGGNSNAGRMLQQQQASGSATVVVNGTAALALQMKIHIQRAVNASAQLTRLLRTHNGVYSAAAGSAQSSSLSLLPRGFNGTQIAFPPSAPTSVIEGVFSSGLSAFAVSSDAATRGMNAPSAPRVFVSVREALDGPASSPPLSEVVAFASFFASASPSPQSPTEPSPPLSEQQIIIIGVFCGIVGLSIVAGIIVVTVARKTAQSRSALRSQTLRAVSMRARRERQKSKQQKDKDKGKEKDKAAGTNATMAAKPGDKLTISLNPASFSSITASPPPFLVGVDATPTPRSKRSGGRGGNSTSSNSGGHGKSARDFDVAFVSPLSASASQYQYYSSSSSKKGGPAGSKTAVSPRMTAEDEAKQHHDCPTRQSSSAVQNPLHGRSSSSSSSASSAASSAASSPLERQNAPIFSADEEQAAQLAEAMAAAATAAAEEEAERTLTDRDFYESPQTPQAQPQPQMMHSPSPPSGKLRAGQTAAAVEASVEQSSPLHQALALAAAAAATATTTPVSPPPGLSPLTAPASTSPLSSSSSAASSAEKGLSGRIIKRKEREEDDPFDLGRGIWRRVTRKLPVISPVHGIQPSPEAKERERLQGGRSPIVAASSIMAVAQPEPETVIVLSSRLQEVTTLLKTMSERVNAKAADNAAHEEDDKNRRR